MSRLLLSFLLVFLTSVASAEERWEEYNGFSPSSGEYKVSPLEKGAVSTELGTRLNPSFLALSAAYMLSPEYRISAYYAKRTSYTHSELLSVGVGRAIKTFDSSNLFLEANLGVLLRSHDYIDLLNDIFPEIKMCSTCSLATISLGYESRYKNGFFWAVRVYPLIFIKDGDAVGGIYLSNELTINPIPIPSIGWSF